MPDSYKHIKSLADSHREEPPVSAWERIEYKLQSVKSTRRHQKLNKVRFWLTIAASLMVIITCSYIIYTESPFIPDYNQSHIAEWEDIGIETDYLYSVQGARKIHRIKNIKSSY